MLLKQWFQTEKILEPLALPTLRYWEEQKSAKGLRKVSSDVVGTAGECANMEAKWRKCFKG
jgi:hypothetical protein